MIVLVLEFQRSFTIRHYDQKDSSVEQQSLFEDVMAVSLDKKDRPKQEALLRYVAKKMSLPMGHLAVEPRPLRPDQTHGFSRLTDRAVRMTRPSFPITLLFPSHS